MKVRYNDVEYNVKEEKDGRVYMVDDEGNEKDIAKSTFETKTEEIKEPKKKLTPKEIKKLQNKHLNEKVPFQAFKDADKYTDDITVTVNGKNYVIQRGVRVMIPRFVFNALKDQERQKAVAANTSQKLTDRYNKLEARINQ